MDTCDIVYTPGAAFHKIQTASREMGRKERSKQGEVTGAGGRGDG